VSSPPPALLGRPFRVADALAAGITRRQLDRNRFRRVIRGVYVEASVPDSFELRCDAARLVLPPSAIFVASTAAALLALPVPDDVVIHARVAPGERKPRIRGLDVGQGNLAPGEVLAVDGRRTSAPGLTFLDCAATFGRTELIVLGDALIYRGWETIAGLTGAVNAHPNRRGVALARAVLTDLEPRAASPGETRSRLVLVQRGYPRPLAGVVIRDENHGWLTEVDMLNEDPPVVFQYDGEPHFRTAAQRRSDALRDETVRDQGYEVVVLTNLDVKYPERLHRRTQDDQSIRFRRRAP
jgi:hypothetical protein